MFFSWSGSCEVSLLTRCLSSERGRKTEGPEGRAAARQARGRPSCRFLTSARPLIYLMVNTTTGVPLSEARSPGSGRCCQRHDHALVAARTKVTARGMETKVARARAIDVKARREGQKSREGQPPSVCLQVRRSGVAVPTCFVSDRWISPAWSFRATVTWMERCCIPEEVG